MKLKLNSKLVISYVLLAALLSLAMLLVSKYFLENQFQVYVSHKQDMKNDEILETVSWIFTAGNGIENDARLSFLSSFGDSLSEQSIVLMVYGVEGELLYCSSLEGDNACSHMSDTGSTLADESCLDFHKTYTRQRYEITRDGSPMGYVLLGYHGPSYYDEGDMVFIEGFNRAFLVMTAVFFFASVAVGLFMAARIASPIRRVTERTKRISDGEYDERVNITTGTAEIDELSSSVDHLAESLQTQFMLKKRMAHAYSHEFRTPLTALQTNIEAIIDGLWAPTNERMESLLAEIFRLSRMVSEIEKLVEVQVKESGGLCVASVDISEMTDRILLSFDSLTKQKGISLSHEKSPCRALADEDKFSQVVFNLVSNAIKYTDRDGNISVSTFERDGRAVFSISDEGIGIAQKDLPYIFEYLYRTDESRARDSGGNGIGLSVVKAVIDAHNGTIDVESTPGLGSVFTVTLPAARESLTGIPQP
jgi:signal transduction histidine kinase